MDPVAVRRRRLTAELGEYPGERPLAVRSDGCGGRAHRLPTSGQRVMALNIRALVR